MSISVSTRKFARWDRLPSGDFSAPVDEGVSKSAAWCCFVALSTQPVKEWTAADLRSLDLSVIQIDGIPIRIDLAFLAAVGVDGEGE